MARRVTGRRRACLSPSFWTPTSWSGWLTVLFWAVLRPRADLALENLALRQQLGVLRRASVRPRVTRRDRLFWVAMARLHKGWTSMLSIVSPATVVKWHRAGFRALWRRKSRHKIGRPEIPRKLYCLIQRLKRENPTWGALRIANELHLLGWKIGSTTVGRYMRRAGNPRTGQHWKTFLKNHLQVTAACDFFVVPSVGLKRLFAFVVLDHDRRRIRHIAVTARPSVDWVVAQLAEAFPENAPRPKYLVHDREKTFRCPRFLEQLAALGIEDAKTAPRQPWMNGYCERVIGTLRRECTDHLVVLGEAHLQRLLREYVEQFYNPARPHMSLAGNAPVPRAPEATPAEELEATPVLGGLHHVYRAAA